MSQSSILVARDADPGDLHSCRVRLLSPCRPAAFAVAWAWSGAYSGHQMCACVLRRVFRACLTSYRHCQASMGSAGAVQLERVGHAQGRCAIVASFKRAEYAADFILLARRALVDRPTRAGGLRGVPRGRPRMAGGRAARQPQTPPAAPAGSRIVSSTPSIALEMLIGTAIVDTRPYSLFPPDDYFSGFILSAQFISASRVRDEVTPFVAAVTLSAPYRARTLARLCSYKVQLFCNYIRLIRLLHFDQFVILRSAHVS